MYACRVYLKALIKRTEIKIPGKADPRAACCFPWSDKPRALAHLLDNLLQPVAAKLETPAKGIGSVALRELARFVMSKVDRESFLLVSLNL